MAGVSAAPGSIGSLLSASFDLRGLVAFDPDTARQCGRLTGARVSRAEAKRVVEAFEVVVLEEFGNAQKVRGGLVQLTVRVEGAYGAQPGDRCGDHDRAQARER